MRRSTTRFLAYLGLGLLLFQCLPVATAQPSVTTENSVLAISPKALINTPHDGTVAVKTRSFDNYRTGSNLNETVLTTTNVMSTTFGKLFQRTVDGDIYAQPLYMPNLIITYTRNVVFVATEHNSVYAFDADDPNASAPLWQVSLGTSGKNITSDYGVRYGQPYTDIQKEVGVTSTPVIDSNTGTIYVVNFACVTDDTVTPPIFCDPNSASPPNPRIYHHYLHALDILTGAEKFGGPVEIEGQVDGDGAGSEVITVTTSPVVTKSIVPFDSRQQLQRPGLVLSNGNLYVTFSGFADTNPYHGWMFGYNPMTLEQYTIWNTTPTSGAPDPNNDDKDGEGGIWQSGQAPAADATGNLYVMTGNGTFDADTNTDPNQRNYGDTFVRLNVRDHTIVPSSWFAPNCQLFLQDVDYDLGSQGPIVIPGTDVLVGAGKQGNIYVLNQSNLGGFTPGSGNTSATNYNCSDPAEKDPGHLADRIDNGVSGGGYAPFVYWQAPQGKRVYVWGITGRLKAFQMNSSTTFSHTAVATGTVNFDNNTMPGGELTVSANGSQAGTGIVWAMHSYSGSANGSTKPGILRAFNAETLQELWNSEQVSARDSLNTGDGGSNPAQFSKFNQATVANGKVYAPTFAPGGTANLGKPAYLVVYGLLASQVTKANDDGALGSLSFALQNSPPNQIITLSPVNTNTITVNDALPDVPSGITLKGSCGPTGPGVTIQFGGTDSGVNGLTLTSGAWLYGVQISGFSGVQISAPSGGNNALNCVRASKT